MSPQALLERPPLDEDPIGPRTPIATLLPTAEELEPTPSPFNLLKKLWAGITGVLLASTGIQLRCSRCRAPEEYARSEPSGHRWDAPLLYTCTICGHSWLEPSWFWHCDS